MSKGIIDIGCAQHQGKREEQEDAFGFSNLSDTLFISHGGFLAVVADGMGGLEHGGEASNLAVKTFLGSYMSKKPKDDIPNSLMNALIKANEAVISLSHRMRALENMGSTLTAAVIHQDKLFWVSVGDSKLYLYREKQLYEINKEHTYLQKLYKKVAKGEITKKMAESDEQAKALTSFLGYLEEFDISHRYIKLREGDSIIICTDGLSDSMRKEGIAEILERKNDAQIIAEELINITVAKDRPFQDNLTVLVIKVISTKIKKNSKIVRLKILLLIVLILLLIFFVNLNFDEYLKILSLK